MASSRKSSASFTPEVTLTGHQQPMTEGQPTNCAIQPPAARVSVSAAPSMLSRPEPIWASPPVFSGKSEDFWIWRRKFEAFAQYHYFFPCLGEDGAIPVGQSTGHTDQDLIEKGFDPELIGKARHAHYALLLACPSGLPFMIISKLPSPKERFDALRKHYTRSSTIQLVALYGELSRVRMKPDQSPSDFFVTCAMFGERLASLGDPHSEFAVSRHFLVGLPKAYFDVAGNRTTVDFELLSLLEDRFTWLQMKCRSLESPQDLAARACNSRRNGQSRRPGSETAGQGHTDLSDGKGRGAGKKATGSRSSKGSDRCRVPREVGGDADGSTGLEVHCGEIEEPHGGPEDCKVRLRNARAAVAATAKPGSHSESSRESGPEELLPPAPVHLPEAPKRRDGECAESGCLCGTMLARCSWCGRVAAWVVKRDPRFEPPSEEIHCCQMRGVRFRWQPGVLFGGPVAASPPPFPALLAEGGKSGR